MSHNKSTTFTKFETLIKLFRPPKCVLQGYRVFIFTHFFGPSSRQPETDFFTAYKALIGLKFSTCKSCCELLLCNNTLLLSTSFYSIWICFVFLETWNAFTYFLNDKKQLLLLAMLLIPDSSVSWWHYVFSANDSHT